MIALRIGTIIAASLGVIVAGMLGDAFSPHGADPFPVLILTGVLGIVGSITAFALREARANEAIGSTISLIAVIAVVTASTIAREESSPVLWMYTTVAIQALYVAYLVALSRRKPSAPPPR